MKTEIRVKVAFHAVERFKQRVYHGGSAGYIKGMVRNALAKGYPILNDHLTFGIVTFVLKPYKDGYAVVTCYRAQQIALPAAGGSQQTGVRDGEASKPRS